MAAWHSLAGYLIYRPHGRLGRLQSRKRWFVFEEGRCQLLLFKTEDDATQKPPLGSIDIKGAAISLSLEETNQFIIHSRGKCHILLAENHESMMIWLLALQAKRDAVNNNFSAIVENGCLSRCEEAEKRKESLPSDQEMQAIIRHAIRAEDASGTIHLQSQRLRMTGDSVDMGSSSSSDGIGQAILGRRRKTVPLFNRNSLFQSSGDTSTDGPWSCPLPSPICDEGKYRRSFDDDEIFDSESGEPQNLLHQKTSSLKSSTNSLASCSEKSSGRHTDRCRELENELIATKCELAKVFNREASLKNLLSEKENLIGCLEERTQFSDSSGTDKIDFCRDSEKCRILQNQNRFLNEEILKLSRMWQQEQMVVSQLGQQITSLESTIDQLKRDYVSLLQSSIRIPSYEGPEILEVTLFGGNRHKDRVCQLVEEARRLNPSLPTYEGLIKNGCHVDCFGFRHMHINEGLTLHYLCRNLNQHYNAQLVSTDHHQMEWKEILAKHRSNLPRTKEMKTLIRLGIPNHLRKTVWVILIRQKISNIIEAKGPHYYSHLVSLAPDSEIVTQNKRQIALDLLRTMPNNVYFSDVHADGVKRMQEVLQAFCLHNPSIGYCQGMNFIVGMALLFMEPEDAFWCLVAVTEKYFLPHYFDQSLVGAQADQEVLRELLADKLPRLSEHIISHEIELCTVTLNWFLAIFFDCVPFETLLRIWDCFLNEGPKVLFRFTLALLKLRETSILEKSDAVAIMKQIKASARLCFDGDGLMKVAFEDLDPFPHRSDITSKQTCYYKTLKESYRKQKLERIAIENKEKMLEELVRISSDRIAIECATVFDGDKLWLCQGHQYLGQIVKVNGSENIMYNLNVEFNTRIMCIHAVNNSVVLLGTLSRRLYAFNIHSKDQLWQCRLNDTALSIYSQEEMNEYRAFTALADGTIAIVDNVCKIKENESPKCSYIQISSSPLMCLRLVSSQLWCAAGNKITVLNTQTMDVVDHFFISSNTMDVISEMVENDYGVWLFVRGSSIIQVWDHSTLVCKMMFDIRENKYPRGTMEDDNYCPFHITSILPYKNSLWVGTADGNLLIFDITSRLGSKISTNVDMSSPQSEKSIPFEDLVCSAQEMQCSSNSESPSPSPTIREQNQSEVTSKSSRDRSDSGYQTVGIDGISLLLQNRKSWDCNGSEMNTDYCSSSTVKGSSSIDFSPRNSCVSNVCDISYNNNCKANKNFKCINGSNGVKNSNENGRHENVNGGSTESSTHLNGVTPFVLSRTNCSSCECVMNAKCVGCSKDSERLHGLSFTHFIQSGSNMSKRRHTLASPEFGLLQPLSEISLSTSDGGESSANNNQTYCNTLTFQKPSHYSSFDNVSHLLMGSRESMLSSPHADSFEYDDVFISYTDEEKSRLSESRLNINNGRRGISYAEELMHLFRLPLKDKTLTDNFKTRIQRRTFLKNRLKKAVSNSDLNLKHNEFTDTSKFPCHNSTFHTVEITTDGNNVGTDIPVHHPRQWSSFEDLSTASNIEYDSVQDSQPRMDYLKLGINSFASTAKSSDSGSYISYASSDIPYTLELTMKEKIKIADQPIKVLLALRGSNEESIISCSGSCKDDESVLKWTVEGDEKLWTNDPIVEVCPYTNTVKPSPYLRSRLPRRSSSILSTTTNPAPVTSQENEHQQPKNGKRLSRMHSLFASITSDKYF